MTERCWIGSVSVSVSASVSASASVRWRLDGRMAFVPEGQADSSQARSAWVAMQRGPVPEGRSKSLSVPQIFVVETEPRHEQATARLP